MSSPPPATVRNALNDAPDAGLTGWSALKWLARGLLGLVLAGWSLLLIAWLTLHWGILPHIQQWRGPLEERASRALGVPVRIGAITVRSSGWVPSFELTDVRLLDTAARPALRLPHVFAAISPRSVLALRFEQLLIDGAELDIRRDASGRVFVAGLELGGPANGGDANAVSDWFFAQSEFVIRGGTLRWTDEQRQAEPLALGDVQLVVRNGLRQHEFRVDATPPSEWGGRFSARGRFTQPLWARRGDWKRWSGSGYADLPRADVHALRRYVALPVEVSEGIGAVRGWFDLKNGEATAATVDVALRAVSMRLAPDLEPLVIKELGGRIVGGRDAAGGTLALQGLRFETGDDLRWPQGDLTFAWRQRPGQPVTGGAFAAQRLDLGLMARIATRVPVGEALRRFLAEAGPQGQLTAVDTTWDGPLQAPLRYRARGRLDDLTVAAQPARDPDAIGRPGVRGATLQLDANERGGTAHVGIHAGAIDLPGVFDEPRVALDQLAADVQWTIQPAPGGAA
ncbi:MAG: TIGR02099 family protein, partial [Pseudomonadota bacterium]|nr:TIGR02099 family protein [Pseudomonadota bacterium]